MLHWELACNRIKVFIELRNLNHFAITKVVHYVNLCTWVKNNNKIRTRFDLDFLSLFDVTFFLCYYYGNICQSGNLIQKQLNLQIKLFPSYNVLLRVWIIFCSFQMSSTSGPGCVFHSCPVPQSWSPGPRTGLSHAHSVKHWARTAHSGLSCFVLSMQTLPHFSGG